MYVTLALKNSGDLYGWGDIRFQKVNSTYPIGLDGVAFSPSLILSDVSMAAAGLYRTVALTKDGKLWFWGIDNEGKVDADPVPVAIPEQDSQPIWAETPVKLPGGIWNDGVAIKKISVGRTVIALKADGSVWAGGQTPPTTALMS